MPGFETIRYEVQDGLATITLSRPDKRNAISLQMFHELGDAAESSAAEPAVKGVLIAADGPSFCAGIDVGLLGELSGLATMAGEKPGEFRSFVKMAQRPFRSLALMPKPTVAAVQGHALGAGFQLALACDLRVVAADARFGMLEARYGLIPDLGGLYHLTRLVGPAIAKELVWSTRVVEVEAETAVRIGLVNGTVDGQDLPAAARDLLREVTAHSPLAAGFAKDLIGGSLDTSLEGELEREAEVQADLVRGIGTIL